MQSYKKCLVGGIKMNCPFCGKFMTEISIPSECGTEFAWWCKCDRFNGAPQNIKKESGHNAQSR